MRVYLKFFRLFLVLMVGVFFLVGSGGGGDDKSTETIADDIKTEVKLNIDDLNIVDLSKYKVVSSDSEIDASSNKKLNIETESKDVVMLLDDGNQPILMGRKYSGDSSVDISMESSAELFVLYFPIFNGVQSKNPKILSQRIRSNPNFPKLVDAIKKEIINENPCPLDPICNYKAKNIALSIAETIKIDDLYTEENK